MAGFACGVSGAGAGELVRQQYSVAPGDSPPTVAFTDPADGSTVSGTVGLAATAEDDVGVASVEFSVDSHALSTTDVVPYLGTWDSTGVVDGVHRLTATATDTAGQVTSATVQVSITNGSPAVDATAPSTPVSLQANAPTDGKVTLTWDPSGDEPGGSGLAGYHVYRADFGTVPIATLGPNAVSYADAPVAPLASYSYTVDAFDAATPANVSQHSTPATVTTPDTSPPAPPSGLRLAAATATSLSLAWWSSTDNVGVAGYQVSRDGTLVSTTSSTRYTDTGLGSGQSYTYAITAVDAAGNASPATALTVRTITVPQAPSGVAAVAGDASATVSWTPPAADGGSPITAYTVTPYVGSSAGTPRTFASTVTTQTVSGLANGTSYTFEVSATNAAGAGPASGASNDVVPASRLTRYQDNNAAIAYVKTWTTKNCTCSSGGSEKRSIVAGASATFTFTGTQVSWISSKSPSGGSAKIYLDGVLVKTVSTYSTATQNSVLAWKSAVLTRGSHRVKIVVVGTAGHPRVGIDAFDVAP